MYNRVDPVDDFEIVQSELIIKDIERFFADLDELKIKDKVLLKNMNMQNQKQKLIISFGRFLQTIMLKL